jgi:hypothetical protein
MITAAQLHRTEESMIKQAYIAKLASWSRKDLLRTCRAAGLTAHKLVTNEDLAELLWNYVGSENMKNGN